ncbi:MAG TPA: Ig-like domain-containing protein, partial [Thermoplasmata archaeon]|nr:Ig-like domain-containing protein [Thermoplasmata archaeon]
PAVTVSADLALDGFLFEPLVPATSVPGGSAAFPVAAPPIDAPNAVLRICAADAAGATTCAQVRIGIDAVRPRVAHSFPAAGTKQVHPDAPLMVTFTESMNPAAVESAFSLNPATPLAFRWARTAADNDTVFVDHPRFLGLRTYIAAIDCPAKDASVPGLSMAGACPLSWTFTTAAAPEILLLSPGPGERLTGGVLQTVRWVAAEEEGSVRITAELSVDGGLTFPFPLVPEEPFVPGDARTERAFPAVSTANAFLRIRAEDSLGLAAVTMSGPFAIDAVAPSLLSASPPDASVDVSPLTDLVFVFSESMDPSSSYALAITPAFRDSVLSWSATSVPFDTLTITHSAVRLGTKVTVSFAGMRDASRPGNAIGDAVSFLVRPDRERPSAEIAIDAEATAGDVVVLDASGSSDNDAIIDYAWTVRDAAGRVVGRARGERVEYRALKPGIFNVTVAVSDAAGNRGEASDVLRVHTLGTTVTTALPPAGPVLGWLALGGGSAFGYGLTD